VRGKAWGLLIGLLLCYRPLSAVATGNAPFESTMLHVTLILIGAGMAGQALHRLVDSYASSQDAKDAERRTSSKL
jgi:hypothetical protein